MKRRLHHDNPSPPQNNHHHHLLPTKSQAAEEENVTRMKSKNRPFPRVLLFVVVVVMTFVAILSVLYLIRMERQGWKSGEEENESGHLSFYYPQPPLVQTTQEVEALKRAWLEDKNDSHNGSPRHPLIHIVHSRFMQEQGNLTALGRARLGLFRIFCLPTMVAQSSQHFLWIIKTDPHLDRSLFEELLELVKPHSNIYVVKSNRNYRIGKKFTGAWRGGAEPDDLQKHGHVYSGQRVRLERAMALHSHFLVLETRLDADDGLHLRYIETVQQMAMDTFYGSKANENEKSKARMSPKWMYWCIPRNMEWHWVDSADAALSLPNNSTNIDKEMISSTYYGALTGVEHESLCVTPGNTVGFALGVDQSEVPIFAHDRIVITLQEATTATAGKEDADATKDWCGLPRPIDCLQFVQNFLVGAIRSRTPTSAGMWNIQLDDKQQEAAMNSADSFVNYMLWDRVHDSFGLHRESVKWMNQYLTDHLLEIAMDNLMGQCTTGHSCKEKARKSLQELIAARRRNSSSATL